MERKETKTESLLGDPSEPITSLDTLRERCLPTLTARIWETCCWPERMADGWKVGDYNFIVIAFSPVGDDRTELYVQFWSEPYEPVLVEVCSGNWNPGAVKYVRPPQRQALEELGFAIGGKAGNFRKEVVVRSPDEAEQSASEALAIVFDVLGYRGEAPLSIKCHRGERAEHAAVHHSLSPEDLLKLALEAGFRAAELPSEDDTPVLTLARERFRAVALLGSRVGDANLFASVLLRTVVRGPAQGSPRLAGRTQRGVAPAMLVESSDGTVWAQTELVFDGGVTAEWIMRGLNRWRATVRECERVVKVSAKRDTTERQPRSTPPVPRRRTPK